VTLQARRMQYGTVADYIRATKLLCCLSPRQAHVNLSDWLCTTRYIQEAQLTVFYRTNIMFCTNSFHQSVTAVTH